MILKHTCTSFIVMIGNQCLLVISSLWKRDEDLYFYDDRANDSLMNAYQQHDSKQTTKTLQNDRFSIPNS